MHTRVVLLICALASSGLASAADVACPSTSGADLEPTFDATLLKEGRFIYHTTLKGESLGETAIEVRRDGAHVVISMSAPKVAQSWKATVAQSFAPLSASLEMQGRKGPYAMELKYAGASITGEEREGGVTSPVNASAEGVVLDQRVDWAAMMASTARTGSSIVVRVFDPSTGMSEMLGRIGETQSALRLDYSICKRDHLEEYTVYATRETPRYMLREDMPNGLVSELVRIEP
ncbi:MAG TPA: hypothetical protein VIV63_17465 [Steroidobacteraceae bacterium]